MLRLFQVFTNVFPRKLTHTRTQKRNNKRNIDFLNERETKKPILDGVKAEMSRCFEQIRNKEYRLNRVRKIGFSFQKFNDHFFIWSKNVLWNNYHIQGGSCNIGPDVGGSVEK